MPIQFRSICKTLLALALTSSLVSSADREPNKVDASTLIGKVLIGYQGWFKTPNDGSGATGWPHWTRDGAPPSATNFVVDFYPDLSEFDKKDLVAAPGITIAGKQAHTLSAWPGPVMAKHFQWMQQYGLDGIFLQRFLASAPLSKKLGDAVVRNCRSSAEKYGRVFAIEYDLTQSNPERVVASLESDWTYLSKELKVTSSPSYLHHNGKPVVSIWGIGFKGHPPEDAAAAMQLIQWLKTVGGATVIEGTPSRWRELGKTGKMIANGAMCTRWLMLSNPGLWGDMTRRRLQGSGNSRFLTAISISPNVGRNSTFL